MRAKVAFLISLTWYKRLPLGHVIHGVFTSQFCPKSNLIKDKIPVLGLDIFARSSFLLVSEKIEHRVQINMYLLHHRCITAQIFNIDCGWFIKYPISKHNKNNPLFNIIAADSRRGRCRPQQIPRAGCAASQACGDQTWAGYIYYLSWTFTESLPSNLTYSDDITDL